MAVPIEIVLYAADNTTADAAARAAFGRFHELNAILSDYDPESELRRLCDTSSAGKPGSRQRRLVAGAGAGPESLGAVGRGVRRDHRAGGSALAERPANEGTAVARIASGGPARVGYRCVRLDPGKHTVELLRPKMRLDLGGIAKGYAVDEAMAALRKHGIARMMVEAGGNIGFGDPPPGKPGWRIGIAPPEPNSPPREYLWLSRVAISTSGDMWQYVVIQGTRYSHLIDPKTGMPLVDHCQVTLVGPDGLSTDGLSTAVAILGPEKGLKLVEDTPGTAAFIVRTVDGQGGNLRVEAVERTAQGGVGSSADLVSDAVVAFLTSRARQCCPSGCTCAEYGVALPAPREHAQGTFIFVEACKGE